MKLTFIKSPEYDIKRSQISQFVSMLETKLKEFSRRDFFEWSITKIKQKKRAFNKCFRTKEALKILISPGRVH